MEEIENYYCKIPDTLKSYCSYFDNFVVEDVPSFIFEEEKNGQFRGHTKNYILGVLEKNEQHENIENRIIKVKCVGTEKDHILVKM